MNIKLANEIIELINTEIEEMNANDSIPEEEKKLIHTIVNEINDTVNKINEAPEEPEKNYKVKMSTNDQICSARVAPNLFITLGIDRVGQQSPDQSNEVSVRATLSLPAKAGYLICELRFGANLYLAGENLHDQWGYPDANIDQRYIEKTFTAPTWQEAFGFAREYLEVETDKLRDVLKERADALKAADNENCN